MFHLLANGFRWAKKKRERNITLILIGLDNAGKTTLLSALRDEPAPKMVRPSYGFKTAKVVDKGLTLTYYDVGGGPRIRAIWPSYFAEVHGAIFVVDAADKARFDEAREALHTALEDKRLAGKPVLVFANKQDVGGAATTAELATALELNSVGDVPIHVQACVAQTPEDATVDASIGDGRKWLVANVQSNLKTLSKRVAEQSAEQRAFEKAEKEKRFARAQAAKAQRLKEEAEEEARAEAKAKQAEEGIVEPASDVPQVNSAPGGPPADAQAAPVAGAAPASMPTDGPRAPATVSEPLPAVTPVKASISGNQVGPASIYAPHSAAGSTLPPVSSSPTPGASSLPPIRNSPDAGGAVALPNAIPSPVPPPPLKGADATERV